MESIATWVAPIATTIAALMTASNLGSRITGYGFIVFTIGSLAWLTLGITTGQSNLLWQNVVLTFLNLFGIWRWLGRQAKFEDGGQHAAEASERASSETLFPVSLTATAAVVGGDGTELGTCVDAMAGRSTGRIAYLVVAEGGVAGVGEKLRRIDWSDVSVDDGVIRTRLDRARFGRLAKLEKDKWPAH